MKNVSKFVQFFTLVLFATTAITNCEMSQEEKTIIECNRKLDRIQEIEASWNYKINKALSHPASPLALGLSVGLIVYLCSSLFIGKHDIIDTGAGCLTGLFSLYEGVEYQKKFRDAIEVLENAKASQLALKNHLEKNNQNIG